MAGTVTFDRSVYPLGVADPRPYLEIITITWTADSAAATVPSTDIPGMVYGVLQRIVTNPGATAPTDNYDITITDSDGFDVLGGVGANRDTTTTEEAEILMVSMPRIVANTLTFNLSGNSVNSALGTCKLYVLR